MTQCYSMARQNSITCPTRLVSHAESAARYLWTVVHCHQIIATCPNSGTVLAELPGILKPAYCVWGEYIDQAMLNRICRRYCQNPGSRSERRPPGSDSKRVSLSDRLANEMATKWTAEMNAQFAPAPRILFHGDSRSLLYMQERSPLDRIKCPLGSLLF